LILLGWVDNDRKQLKTDILTIWIRTADVKKLKKWKRNQTMVMIIYKPPPWYCPVNENGHDYLSSDRAGTVLVNEKCASTLVESGDRILSGLFEAFSACTERILWSILGILAGTVTGKWETRKHTGIVDGILSRLTACTERRWNPFGSLGMYRAEIEFFRHSRFSWNQAERAMEDGVLSNSGIPLGYLILDFLLFSCFSWSKIKSRLPFCAHERKGNGARYMEDRAKGAASTR